MQEASWVLSNIAAGSIEHKQLIYSSEAVPLLLRLLSTAPFDIRKEVAYVLGNLCVTPCSERPNLVEEHLVSLVQRGCLSGFIDLVRSADIEAARLGLQFVELVSKSCKLFVNFHIIVHYKVIYVFYKNFFYRTHLEKYGLNLSALT